MNDCFLKQKPEHQTGHPSNFNPSITNRFHCCFSIQNLYQAFSFPDYAAKLAASFHPVSQDTRVPRNIFTFQIVSL